MKKNIVFLLYILVACLLVGCGCSHDWAEASCTTPKICRLCEKVSGEPLGHQWQDATCTEVKSCAVCALTEGEPLGHDWAEPTCETPQSCKRCALTQGEAPSHQWSRANCQQAKYCAVCQQTIGELGPHLDITAIDNEGEDGVWFVCECGAEVTMSAQDLTMQLLQGTWTLRAVVKDGSFYRPDPENRWNESTWLEFPTVDEPLGFEIGTAELVAEAAVPQVLLSFKKTTAMLYAGGPEIPVLTCNAQSDYGDNQYLSTPLILTVGNWDYHPEDYTDEEFINKSLNGQLLTLWRIHTDATYIYQYEVQ